MKKFMKLFHHLGIVMFLGSIITFASVSMLVKDRSLSDLVFAREIIKAGSYYLTLTGLALLFISGAVLLLMEYRTPGHFWLNIKKVLTLLIILNTFIFILPAVNSALDLAKESLAKGGVLPEYNSAYMKESIAGGINAGLAFVSIVVSFWRKSAE